MKKMKRNKPITFFFSVELYTKDIENIQIEDRRRLMALAKHSYTISHIDNPKFVYIFYLSDIHKVKALLSKYNIHLTYPDKTELKKYGLSYSGYSLEIEGKGDSFLIRQYFPDGRIETHIIPKDRVFTVYYAIKNYGKKKFKGSEIWPILCRKFGLNQYFDRRGEFHKNSFNGARSNYFDFYYYPLKVLDHIGKVKFSRNGMVEVIE